MAQSILFTIVLLIFLSLTNTLEAFSIKRAPPHHVTWIEDLTVEGLENAGENPSVGLLFTLHGENERIKLQLSPNDEILSKLEAVHYLRPDGTLSGTKPIKKSLSSVFKGESFINDAGNGLWSHVGTARIAIREYGDDPLFDGTFTIGNELFHVQLDSAFRRIQSTDYGLPPQSSKPFMVVWRDGDDERHDLRRRDGSVDELTCGLGSDDFGSLVSTQSRIRRNGIIGRAPRLWGRQDWGGNGGGTGDLRDTIGSTAGCPNTRVIALLGIVTDCTYTGDFGSRDEVEAHIISEINSASQLYEETFNISLAIRNLSISDSDCASVDSTAESWNVPCSDSVDTRDRLSRFSAWRGRFQDGNALWTLLTGCRGGSTVGISWLGEVCRQGSVSFNSDGVTQTSSSTNIVVRNSQEWQVLAHEIGHSFGATHDCTSDTCNTQLGDSGACCPLSASTCNAEGQYIMNPSPGSGIRTFSPCTIGAICSALGSGAVRSDCLQGNEDVTVIDTPTCATGASGSAGCDFTEPTTGPTGGPTVNTFGGRNGDSDDWFDENRNVVIIVASVGGSLVAILIVACIFFRVRRKRRARMVKEEQANMQYMVNRVTYR